jgi:hypothetical protein
VAEISVMLLEVRLTRPHHPDGNQLEALLLEPAIPRIFLQSTIEF